MRTTKSIVIVLVLSFNRRFVSTHTTAAAAFAAVPSSTSSTMLRSVTTSTSTSQNSSSSSIADARDQRLVYGANDALFGYIEDQQGHKPFGKVLDAGTGVHSLRWIATLGDLGRTTRNNRTTTSRHKGLTDFVAVTADETMRHTVQHELDALGLNHLGKIVIGNWFPAAASNNNNNNNKNKNKNSNDAGTTDEAALRSIDYDETGQRQLYDTIIADYLIGAMDGFCKMLCVGGGGFTNYWNTLQYHLLFLSSCCLFVGIIIYYLLFIIYYSRKHRTNRIWCSIC